MYNSERLTDEKNFVPTGAEKLSLYLLTEILKEISDSSESILLQKLLLGGHYWAINSEFTGIFHNHVDNPKSAQQVINILDMWYIIENSYRKFSTQDKKMIEDHFKGNFRKEFMGFSGNDETEHLGIARIFIDDLNKFGYFKGRNLNSHFPTLSENLAIYSKFKEIRPHLADRDLELSEFIELEHNPIILVHILRR
ncbi:YfbU family protein [Roseomonas sp. USHLN139]|uniref:YfbU family protein n=1 Tax=Roseomonas sp. USHLN139 TaxID=3081298 RepID=UPI003B015BF7